MDRRLRANQEARLTPQKTIQGGAMGVKVIGSCPRPRWARERIHSLRNGDKPPSPRHSERMRGIWRGRKRRFSSLSKNRFVTLSPSL